MKIVICDDEHEVLEKVAQICKKSFLSKVTIYAFPSAESLLKIYQVIWEQSIFLFLILKCQEKAGYG